MSDEILEPTAAQIRAFERAAKALAELGRAGLRIYLAEDSLHLMAGPSHDKDRPCQHNVRASVTIPRSGGGDW